MSPALLRSIFAVPAACGEAKDSFLPRKVEVRKAPHAEQAVAEGTGTGPGKRDIASDKQYSKEAHCCVMSL